MRRKTRFTGWLLLLCLCCSPAWAQSPWSWRPNSLELLGPEVHFDWAVPTLVSSPGDTAHWQKLLDRHIAARLNEFQNSFEFARRERLRRQALGLTDPVGVGPAEPASPLMDLLPGGPKRWESQGGYKVVWTDAQQMVLLWEGQEYRGEGQVLPVLEVTVLSSAQPDSLLPASSLFREDASALEILSNSSLAGLLEQFPNTPHLDYWAVHGTRPRWENFSLVYPTYLDGPPRFEVLFPSYQVGPYASGTPKVEIPWELLAPWAPLISEGVPIP